MVTFTYPISLWSGIGNGSSIRDLDKYSWLGRGKQGPQGRVVQNYRMFFLRGTLISTKVGPMRECKATSTGDTIRITTRICKATSTRDLTSTVANLQGHAKLRLRETNEILKQVIQVYTNLRLRKTLISAEAGSTRITRHLNKYSSVVYKDMPIYECKIP